MKTHRNGPLFREAFGFDPSEFGGGCTLWRWDDSLPDTRRGNDERQSQEKKHDREAGQPGWKPKPFGNRIDQLEAGPRGANIDEEHLPQGAAVDLDNEPLEMGHRASAAKGCWLRL